MTYKGFHDLETKFAEQIVDHFTEYLFIPKVCYTIHRLWVLFLCLHTHFSLLIVQLLFRTLLNVFSKSFTVLVFKHKEIINDVRQCICYHTHRLYHITVYEINQRPKFNKVYYIIQYLLVYLLVIQLVALSRVVVSIFVFLKAT